MTRNVFRCWLASLLLGPVCAFALEVGEIQVDSALNQLFDARIPLPTLSPEELGRISVKVASPTMFKEFGLDRGETLDNLVFSIQYDAEGKVYVKVVSIKPIHEPSLALLLEFGWPRGKTFREFTVLLDPVRRLVEQPAAGRTKTVLDTSADTEADSVSESPSADIVVNRTIQYPDQPTSSTEASSSGSWAYRPGDVYGPVASGEGLWGIALKVRPDPGITRDQMMQALFQANPDAFSKVGVDGLRIGALLRIPTFQEIADFTGSAVARQLAATEKVATEKVATEKAAMEKAATDDARAGIVSAGEASAVEPVAAGTNASNLAVFPLARPSALEPILPAPEPKSEIPTPEPAVVAALESKPEVSSSEPAVVAVPEPKPKVPTTPESAMVAAPEPAMVAAPEPEPEVSTAESKPEVSTTPESAVVAAPKPKPEVPESAVVAASEPKPEVSTSEPVVVAVSDSKLEVAEPDLALNTSVSGPANPMVIAPVSATPLLFLVVSEVMASATAQVPHVPVSPQSLFDARTVDAVASEPIPEPGTNAATPAELDRQTTAEPDTASQATNDMSTTVVADVFELSPTADIAESLIAESIARPVAGFAALPVFESAEAVQAADSTEPQVVESATPPEVKTAEVTEVAEVAEPSKAEIAEAVQAADSTEPQVVESAAPPRVETAEAVQTVEATEPPGVEIAEVAEVAEVTEVAELVYSTAIDPEKSAMPAYKGGEQYGPVAPNERLWDIAAKVRPTPDIGIDIMMKALFAINPTAFSKAGMDYLKVGVTLRVPTLQEIVDHTDSKAAKQLLEQQAVANKTTGPADSSQSPLPSPPPAAASGSGADPESKPTSPPSAIN